MNWTEIKRVKESLRRVDGYQRLSGRESEADRALTTKAVPCCLWSETHAQGRRHQPALTWTKPNSWRGWGGEQLDRQSSISRAWGIPLYLPHTTPPLHPLPPIMHHTSLPALRGPGSTPLCLFISQPAFISLNY